MSSSLCHSRESGNPKYIILVTLFVFIACIFTGFWISRHKLLWTDEIASQTGSVSQSYSFIWQGNIQEGGNTPLFYTLQKGLESLIGYQMPYAWTHARWTQDAHSQFVLRINPIFFMSLSVAIVFYYFCMESSWAVGFISLFIYFSSFMLWGYWAEARPYAMVVFFTTVQSIILLKKINNPQKTDDKGLWISLAVVNILSALTFVLTLGQILGASLIWFIYKERDWKKYIWITLVPALIVVFYCFKAVKINFYFDLKPDQIIRASMSRERLDCLVFFLGCVLVHLIGARKLPVGKNIIGKEILKPVPYVIFTVLVLVYTAAAMSAFVCRHYPTTAIFPVSNRYFIYLLPIGVLSTTMVAVAFFKSLSKNRFMQGGVVVVMLALGLQHFLKVVPTAIHLRMSTP